MAGICRGRIVGGLQGLSVSPGNLSDVFILEICLLGFPHGGGIACCCGSVTVCTSDVEPLHGPPAGPKKSRWSAGAVQPFGWRCFCAGQGLTGASLARPVLWRRERCSAEDPGKLPAAAIVKYPWALKKDHLPLVEAGEQTGGPPASAGRCLLQGSTPDGLLAASFAGSLNNKQCLRLGGRQSRCFARCCLHV